MNNKENVLGERLRALRRIRDNISQKEFAVELGIPQPTLSSYESGKIKPNIYTIINIADKCGVSMDWLCGRNQISHMKSEKKTFVNSYKSEEKKGKSIKVSGSNKVRVGVKTEEIKKLLKELPDGEILQIDFEIVPEKSNNGENNNEE